MSVFLADPGPLLSACAVNGCRYGTNGLGLCLRHRGRFTRSGQSGPATWATTVLTVSEPDHAQCGLPFCTLWIEYQHQLFCKSHHTRWCQLGRPAIQTSITHCLDRGKACINFSSLTPQLKLEFQYAVQCRFDDNRITAPTPVINWAIRVAANAGISSLLDSTKSIGKH